MSIVMLLIYFSHPFGYWLTSENIGVLSVQLPHPLMLLQTLLQHVNYNCDVMHKKQSFIFKLQYTF